MVAFILFLYSYLFTSYRSFGVAIRTRRILQKSVFKVPPSIYYIPEFVSADDEESLLRNIYEAPKPKWTQLSNRRLQNWGGLPHPKGMVPEKLPKWLEYQCNRVFELGIFESKRPNHVLINEYLAGQGIMPHTDGPLYYPTVSILTLGGHSVINFYHPIKEQSSDCLEDDHDKICCQELESEQSPTSTSLIDRHFSSVFLEPRSLIIFRDDIYSKYLHGIEERQSDLITDKFSNLDRCKGVSLGDMVERKTRLSLTIRVVPKVLKSQSIFGRTR